MRFSSSIRGIIGKKLPDKDEIQLPNICNVNELLGHLSKKYGIIFTEYLRAEVGLIVINGVSIYALKGFETGLKEGDVVAFFPVLSGG